ncbi:MAG: hypothetical protein JNK48_05860 [Bryobacterales bacterium]|nr:hypothetical protein [Bryobacterales bacterium]
MTPTTALPPAAGAPACEWLQRLIVSFHDGRRALPLRANRLIEQLHAEAEIVAGASRVLLSLMEAGNCRQALSDLEQCLEAVRTMDMELTATLCRTLITPIDAEDLKVLSAHSVRFVRQQTRIGRMIAAEGDGGLGSMQQVVSEWAGCFARAIQFLPSKDSRREAENMRAAASPAHYLLSDERCRLLSVSTSPCELMRELARIDVFEEVVEQMKLADQDLAGMILKWQ